MLTIRGTKEQIAAVRLALQIADEDSRCTIDCNCKVIRSKSGAHLWYELDPNDEQSWFYVHRAASYLKMRGKLRVRSSNPNHVKAVI